MCVCVCVCVCDCSLFEFMCLPLLLYTPYVPHYVLLYAVHQMKMWILGLFQIFTEVVIKMDSDSSTKFIGSLTKFLQSLCNGYVEFQKGVELVGHIYLSIDTGEKVDYILHERVSKNDENSVSFVSNSYHAQPFKGSEKMSDKKDARGSVSSDEDDIMIVDRGKDTLGSTNTGTVLSGSMKRKASSMFGLYGRGSSSLAPSAPKNRLQAARPPATATSQGNPQENISVGDMKLEQITSDELLSLASQVGDGGSSQAPQMSDQRGGSGQIGQTSLTDTAGRPVWIKQEALDDTHGGPDTGGLECAGPVV